MARMLGRAGCVGAVGVACVRTCGVRACVGAREMQKFRAKLLRNTVGLAFCTRGRGHPKMHLAAIPHFVCIKYGDMHLNCNLMVDDHNP